MDIETPLNQSASKDALKVEQATMAYNLKEKREQAFSIPVPERLNPLFEQECPWIPSRYSRGPWTLATCSQTGFVYLLNPPRYDAYAQDYAWEKTLEIETTRRKEANPFRAKLSSLVKKGRQIIKRSDKLSKEAVKIIASLPARDRRFRVVDIGCGDGLHACNIAKRGLWQHGLDIEPIGIEISDFLADEAQSRLKRFDGRVIHCPAIEGLAQLENKSVDLIVLMSFLEHEINPGPLLRLCADKLAKDGSIVIKVPNFDCWNRLIQKDQWCGFRYPDHVNYFSPSTLRILIERVGLKIQRMGWQDRTPTNDNMWAIVTC